MAIKSYIETNENRFLDELFSLIRIPSVSAQQEHKPDNDAGLRIFLYRQLLLPLPPDARHRALLSFPRTYARIGTHIVHSDCLHPNAQHHCRMVLHNILGHNRAAPCLHLVSLHQG